MSPDDEAVIAILGPDLPAPEWARRLDVPIASVRAWMVRHWPTHPATEGGARAALADLLRAAERDPDPDHDALRARAQARALLARMEDR